jgi:hypothetical protein
LAEKYGLNLQDQAKTPEERRRAEEEMRAKHSARGGAGADPMASLSSLLSALKTYIVDGDRLPQHAMS